MAEGGRVRPPSETRIGSDPEVSQFSMLDSVALGWTPSKSGRVSPGRRSHDDEGHGQMRPINPNDNVDVAF